MTDGGQNDRPGGIPAASGGTEPRARDAQTSFQSHEGSVLYPLRGVEADPSRSCPWAESRHARARPRWRDGSEDRFGFALGGGVSGAGRGGVSVGGDGYRAGAGLPSGGPVARAEVARVGRCGLSPPLVLGAIGRLGVWCGGLWAAECDAGEAFELVGGGLAGFEEPSRAALGVVDEACGLGVGGDEGALPLERLGGGVAEEAVHDDLYDPLGEWMRVGIERRRDVHGVGDGRNKHSG